MFRVARLVILFCVVVFLAEKAFAQLEATFDAHGGLGLWRGYGTVEYDMVWESPRRVLKDQQTFDLHSRNGLIRGDNYLIGANGSEVWIRSSLDALGGMPPRFYVWTPFYFFAMPFVFADPGAKLEALGRRTVGGVEYDAVKITYQPGTGDSPEDYYIAHVDPKSRLLKVVAYIVTYPKLRKGRPLEELEPHALVFDQWQVAGGLSVPHTARFFHLKNDNIEGEPIGTIRFDRIQFSAERPEADRFKKPDDAIVAPLE